MFFEYLRALGVAALASALNDGLATAKGVVLCKVLGVVHAVVCADLLVGSAYQLRHQQRLIEGQRKEIGLWLKEQAQGKPQTVFLECVGYIGYFSELRMTDFSGLTCPPMVEAPAQGGRCQLGGACRRAETRLARTPAQ